MKIEVASCETGIFPLVGREATSLSVSFSLLDTRQCSLSGAICEGVLSADARPRRSILTGSLPQSGLYLAEAAAQGMLSVSK